MKRTAVVSIDPGHALDHDPARTASNGRPSPARAPAAVPTAPATRPTGAGATGPDHSPRAGRARRPGHAPHPGPASLLRRLVGVHRHFIGLLAGALVARANGLPPERRLRLRSLGLRATAGVLRPLLMTELRRAPFARQLRRRLELLGPTYVKLGQIMAIREDLLPAPVCRELQELFDHVPPVPFPVVRGVIERELDQPLAAAFRWVDREPLGSASIAQVHRAETAAGDAVVVKVMKPGIRESVETDLKLLLYLGALLQRFIPRYQPRRITEEFAAYTIREVDFTAEADNAETFAANFADLPDVRFPAIHRDLSTASVLTMEYLDGFKPSEPPARLLSDIDRDRLIDLGAAAIIRMLYQDGFFHADLHPANLLVLRTDPPTLGFVDLGMAGRFEGRTRRRMLYYYHALVTGDVEGAASFLTDMAEPGPRADPDAFRRAVVDLSRRFITRAERGDFSIAQLILESIGLGGRYRVWFPVEMTLMVKALVTFEGVGRMLDPHLDVAALSRRHVARVLKRQFTLPALSRELIRETPELVDAAVQLPQLLVAGAHFLERAFDRRPPPDPTDGLRSAVLSGACLLGAVIGLTSGAHWVVWTALFAIAAVLGMKGRS